MKTKTKTKTASDIAPKPIMTALAKRVPKSRLDEAQAFANVFYRRMDPDEYAQHGAEGWAALAADMLEFARVRKAGKPLVRLFNPSLKQHGWESPHTIVQVVNDDMPFLVDSVTMALAELGHWRARAGPPGDRIPTRQDRKGGQGRQRRGGIIHPSGD